MSEGNDILQGPPSGSVIAAIQQICDRAKSELESASDLQEAFDSVTQLATGLRDIADDVALTRAKVAAQIREAENLSLEGLAQKLGMSKQRAFQLLKAASQKETQK
ncbi:hypothetical protein [Nonomuraea sp. NEAU-A123]|uniref:hypothetical protein n=1 Tax=Nonomuraea sp. NEAU-A123 TaxID=2839649 RepID=UPI001BE408DA|nr:hypothetical protein [Nonomuraea sp. NEAU-A123]MBT2225997.1 hypothetical protein [Nonomuraea sp. NEAU-A123]